MQWLARASRYPWAIVGFVGFLLALLAALQYGWTGELSRAEGESLQMVLESSTRHIAHDLDREVTRVVVHFLADRALASSAVGEAYSSRMREWKQAAPYPDLVLDVFRTQRIEDGSFQLARLDVERAGFEPVAWPPELEPVRSALRQATRESLRELRQIVQAVGVPLAPEVPAVVLPLRVPGQVDGRPLRRLEEIGLEEFRQALSDCLVVQLDLTFMRETFLPTLISRYLATEGQLDYDLVVLGDDASGQVIFQSNPELAIESFQSADAETPFFALLRGEELRALSLDRGLSGTESVPRFRPRSLWWLALVTTAGPPPTGAWRLLARHRSGSLAAVVARHRARNLAIVLAVLALLGVSIALILASSRRAQELANRQVEFVAGVSHELRTPLAVIRSLSQNLADGLVQEEQQARRYGATLEREESRLSRMVEQVLHFARPRSGPEARAFRRVDLRSVVEQALADAGTLLDEHGARVEVDLPESPIPLEADPDALGRAIHNLIANAAKYGGDDKWVDIRLSSSDGEGRPEAALSVSDHGRGIAREDLAHLFEPFYRGREVSQAQIPGSGLGLSLVKRIVEDHGGRVEVRSAPGEGSTFTLHLPTLEGAGDG